MSTFVVNVQTLEALQQAVMGLAVELDNGGYLVGPYAGSSLEYGGSPYETVSGGQLAGADIALGEFFDNWQSSLGQIGKNMEDVATALGNAAENYAEVNDHVCLVNP